MKMNINKKRLCLRLFTIALLTAIAINSLIGNVEFANARVNQSKDSYVNQSESSLALVDIGALGELIKKSVETSQNREGFVKGLAETAFYQLVDGKYNVMVFNLSQPYTEKLRGVQLVKSDAYYDNTQYGVWIFEDGEFINEGDGGYINWAFKGWFERTGDQGHHVIFRKP